MNICALEIEPPDGRGACQDESTRSLDVLREMQVAVHLDGYIGQVVCEDRRKDIVVDAFGQSDG